MAFFRQSNGSIPPGSPLVSGITTGNSSVSRMVPIEPAQVNISNASPYGGLGESKNTDHTEELWQACAGPLVYVPKLRERVWYFPQGHMEQVTASDCQGKSRNMPKVSASDPQGSSAKIPSSGLPTQILCSVVNRQLRAEVDTDEVYAQIQLLPEPQEALDASDMRDEEVVPAASKSSIRLFTKILTASDTSTHGGFSVLRKHAEECLPPLDMSQDPPTQDLVAKDLHGNEWKFRHTYRGHPRRHLLTTGWSVFVSHKRLLAGDAVIFLRGENGELRVGIRRAKRQQATQQAVISHDSMHMGVVATASVAVGTRTIFTVFYKPRLSSSAFLVPVEKLAKAMSVKLSVGMRFKMQFETEDASDRSFAGTIVGIEDLDALNWANSKWRSLKVNWDEIINIDRPDRVSPWEIELSVSSSSPGLNHPPVPRSKRTRPSPSNMIEFSNLGSSKATVESAYPPMLSRVLQDQEPRSIGIGSLWRSPQLVNSTPSGCHYSPHLPHTRQTLGAASIGHQSLHLPSHRTSFYSTPFMSSLESDFKLPGNFSSHSLLEGSAWPPPSSERTPNWFMTLQSPLASPSTPARQERSLVTGNIPMPQHQPQQHHPLSLFPPTFSLWEASKQDKGCANVSAKPVTPPVVVGEGGCKLFGVSLKPSNVVPEKPPTKGEEILHQSTMEVEMEADAAKQMKSDESAKNIKSDASSEQVRLDQNVLDSRMCCNTRSCIKVIKKGSMIGRGIDLTRFDGYASLFKELEDMFNMGAGELSDPSKGWIVAYCDGEGDTMHAGDDPWPEFCTMVKKLFILSPEEAGDKPVGRDPPKTQDPLPG